MKYIFQITVKRDHTVEEYVAMWKDGSSIIQKQSGARGTRLYRSCDDPNVLLAIAEWDSKEAREMAKENLDNLDSGMKEIMNQHNEYGEITKIGAFDETEWEVMP